MASSMDGPTNTSAQSRQAPSSTCLPSMRIRRQSADSAACATSRFSATDLPPPGSPPTRMFFSASSMFTWSPNSSMPTWAGSKMEKGNTGTAAGGISVAVMMRPSFKGDGMAGAAPEGAAVRRLLGGGEAWPLATEEAPDPSVSSPLTEDTSAAVRARSARSCLNGDCGAWLAARVSRRMTSMVTSWDQRGFRVTRASRA